MNQEKIIQRLFTILLSIRDSTESKSLRDCINTELKAIMPEALKLADAEIFFMKKHGAEEFSNENQPN